MDVPGSHARNLSKATIPKLSISYSISSSILYTNTAFGKEVDL